MLRKWKLVLLAVVMLGTTVLSPVFTNAAGGNSIRQSGVAAQMNQGVPEGVKPLFQTGTIAKLSGRLARAEAVVQYLNTHKEKYGIKGDQRFKAIIEEKDKVANGHVVRLQQTFRGIPIFGASQIAHVSADGTLRSISGTVVSISHSFRATQKITKEEAIAVAKKDAGAEAVHFVQSPSAELNIYMKDDQPYLVYKVELNYLGHEPARWLYFIDAGNGKIVHKFNSLAHFEGSGTGVLGETRKLQMQKSGNAYTLIDATRGSKIVTHDAVHTLNLPGKIWTSSDAKLDSPYEAPAVDAHYFAGLVYDYYKNVYGRNGLDGKNGEIHSTVHYAQDYNNAFWNGYQIVYGDGDGDTFLPLSGALDVVAHELTHAVTEHTANLTYEGESGAINEAISDIFAELIEARVKGSTDWLIGEDVYTPGIDGDAIRSLKDPAAYGYPDHYSKRYTGEEDNGGVHINSSIINKAAYLISEGGTHYGVTVTGIGKDKLGKILYRALTVYLTPSSNFHQLRLAMIQAAKDLYKDGPEAKTVDDAFRAVGIDAPSASAVQTLNVGGSIERNATQAGDTFWFKIQPTVGHLQQATHLFVEAEGAQISLYPSWNEAQGDAAYPPYKEQEGMAAIPLAWKGPYYVKVTAEQPGTITVQSGVVSMPIGEIDSTSCLAEMAAKNEASLQNSLSSLRQIRDRLLRPSAQGKQLISLYYRISRETVGDFIVDPSFRADVIRYWQTLQPLVKELSKTAEGTVSTYRLSDRDFAAMEALKNRLEEKVSGNTKKEIEQYWAKIKNGRMMTVGELLKQLGLPNVFGNAGPIIVKMKGAKSEQEAKQNLEKALGSDMANTFIVPLANSVVRIPYTYALIVNDPNKLYKIMQRLTAAKTVEYVEKSHTGIISANDVYYAQQWPLEKINYEGMLKRISTRKLSKTVVAVIDTGVNGQLADLDGSVDHQHGYDFVNNNREASDALSHGTAVASLIAAKKDNYYSIAGIHPAVTILPLKACGDDGICSSEDVAMAIRYAVNQKAKVINLSLGFTQSSRLIDEQLKYAHDHGVTIVAAAGNGGETRIDYPANVSYVIAVGATNKSDELAWFSNIGRPLDVVAPGDGVPALTAYGGTAFLSGTSLAAAHVSAAAALIYSWKGSQVSTAEVEQILIKTAKDLGTKGHDDYFGYGRIDIGKIAEALSQSPKSPSVHTIDDNDKMIQGTAQPGVTIVALNGSRFIGKAKTDRKGKFSIKITPQKAKSVIMLYAETTYGVRSAIIRKTVLDKTPPKAPKVNAVTYRSRYVTGKTEPYAYVTVKVGHKTIGKGTADKTGAFRIAIKTQKAGTVLKVYARDRSGNTSHATTVIVKKKR
ncbi:M4 family metallopeptidase [Geobacillus jurassicus]|uniref:M4 family metallopeptidase n=1 Tax=Geobacillus jurassicus TaxID=235932 RepID=A0ABV6GS71_9BACL|nr:M4 family metallopeptidase [Geobacillus jurassicus]